MLFAFNFPIRRINYGLLISCVIICLSNARQKNHKLSELDVFAREKHSQIPYSDDYRRRVLIRNSSASRFKKLSVSRCRFIPDSHVRIKFYIFQLVRLPVELLPLLPRVVFSRSNPMELCILCAVHINPASCGFNTSGTYFIPTAQGSAFHVWIILPFTEHMLKSLDVPLCLPSPMNYTLFALFSLHCTCHYRKYSSSGSVMSIIVLSSIIHRVT